MVQGWGIASTKVQLVFWWEQWPKEESMYLYL
jgi:hypothetical protein